MDFFEHQEIARRRTTQMVVLYCLAVVMIVAAIYFVVVGIFFYGAVHSGIRQNIPLWDPRLLLWVVLCASGVILIGTLYKIHALSQGGRIVAEMLGGRLIDPNTIDQNERRVLNVVEEMAIASGIRVPDVYLLEDENGINAFAAGFQPSDAVIGVTRGCVNNFSRDELQGVIAHEFSHILNGDMRLNIRLIGILNGILIIALIGYWLVRIVLNSRRGSGSSRGKKGGAVILILLFGLALMAIGYIGVFFGKLIKSAVSRQREFLADASSVQFTRNPAGIAGALKKIMEFSGGSRIQSHRAEELSHMFFSNGLRGMWFALMATHPPLEERIRRIDSSFMEVSEAPVSRADESGSIAPALAHVPAKTRVDARASLSFAVNAGQAIRHVGSLTPAHLEYAAGVLSAMPSNLVAMSRESAGAQAVIYSLLISGSKDVRDKQLAYLVEHVDAKVGAMTQSGIGLALEIGPDRKIPVVDMALPALRRMNAEQYEVFRGNVFYLASTDMEIDIFEYTLMRIVVRNLDPIFRGIMPQSVLYFDAHQIDDECRIALGTLAWHGNEQEALVVRAFGAGIAALSRKFKTDLPPKNICSLEALDKALETFAAASPMLKRQIVGACAACIASDGRMTVEEGELLRAIADSLDCPMPPFLQQAAV